MTNMTREEFQEFQTALDKLVDLAVNNNKPSLPSNLDEAALQFTVQRSQLDNGGSWSTSDIGAAFKAGAEWMAKQLPVSEAF